MKRTRIRLAAWASIAVLVATGMLSAGIVHSEAIVLDADGKASIPVEISPGIDSAAGIQGRILYDPAKVNSISLSQSPDQPASFLVRSYVTEPGVLRFLAYSKFKTLNSEHPAFYCQIQAKPTGDLKRFESVLVCELELSSSPEAKTHSETNSFVNLPVLGAPETAVRQKWVLYSK